MNKRVLLKACSVYQVIGWWSPTLLLTPAKQKRNSTGCTINLLAVRYTALSAYGVINKYGMFVNMNTVVSSPYPVLAGGLPRCSMYSEIKYEVLT